MAIDCTATLDPIAGCISYFAANSASISLIWEQRLVEQLAMRFWQIALVQEAVFD